jgi:hypothetical protein
MVGNVGINMSTELLSLPLHCILLCFCKQCQDFPTLTTAHLAVSNASLREIQENAVGSSVVSEWGWKNAYKENYFYRLRFCNFPKFSSISYFELMNSRMLNICSFVRQCNTFIDRVWVVNVLHWRTKEQIFSVNECNRMLKYNIWIPECLLKVYSLTTM